MHRLSLRSTSTGSSLLSDNSHSDLLSSSTQSEPTRHPPSPGFDHYRNIRDDNAFGNRDSHHSACFQADSLCGFNVGGQFSQSEHLQPELVDELRCRGTWQQDSVTANKEAMDTTELDAVNLGTPGCEVQQEYASKGAEKGVHVSPQEGTLLGGLSYSSDKKKNTTALNAVSFLNCFLIYNMVYLLSPALSLYSCSPVVLILWLLLVGNLYFLPLFICLTTNVTLCFFLIQHTASHLPHCCFRL